MAGSVVVACKRALVSLLQARPGLTGVQVTYGYAGDDEAEPERVFTTSSRADHDPASLKSGRTFRNEATEFTVRVMVLTEGLSAEDAEDRAMAIGKEVEECVADNRTLGGVAGLNFAVVARWDLDYVLGAAGFQAQIDYVIRYAARLT